jgi:hypothetical protein
VPLAAGLALLGMLGSDPRSDLGAHFFGFLAGAVLGALAGLLLPGGGPGPRAQSALAGATLAAVLASWALAVTA